MTVIDYQWNIIAKRNKPLDTIYLFGKYDQQHPSFFTVCKAVTNYTHDTFMWRFNWLIDGCLSCTGGSTCTIYCQYCTEHETTKCYMILQFNFSSVKWIWQLILSMCTRLLYTLRSLKRICPLILFFVINVGMLNVTSILANKDIKKSLKKPKE